MKHLDLQDLTKKFAEGTCTPEELELLENWYLQWKPEQVDIDPSKLNAVMGEVWDALPVHKGTIGLSIYTWRNVVIAATVIFVLAFAVRFSGIRYGADRDNTPLLAMDMVIPGSNKAFLELADGRKINVTAAHQGLLAKQTGINITKTEDGQLIYNVTGDPSKITEFNTIIVPKGGKYVVCLPDGTKVWLNAESTLKYPASFASLPERRVELVGEAYFDVVHHKDQGFKVYTPDQVVSDIGTQFNINAYQENGNTKTTVIEGEATVNNTRLTAGQQAILTGKKINRIQVDADDAIAWKNGFFQFTNEDIKTGLAAIARWYDVEIVYEDPAAKKLVLRKLNGDISREGQLSSAIEIIKVSGVNCKVVGRKLIVLK